MKYISKYLSEIDAETLDELKKLTLGPKYSMFHFIKRIQEDPLYPNKYFVTMAIKDKLIVGWSIVWVYWAEAHFFVREEYRRQGIGTELFKRAEAFTDSLAKDIEVGEHDIISALFFKSCGLDWEDIQNAC